MSFDFYGAATRKSYRVFTAVARSQSFESNANDHAMNFVVV
jgi:hypothetical protein